MAAMGRLMRKGAALREQRRRVCTAVRVWAPYFAGGKASRILSTILSTPFWASSGLL